MNGEATKPGDRGRRPEGGARGGKPTGRKDVQLHALLAPALEEARIGFSEGGVPVGAALFDERGTLLGRGRNRRVQDNDPSAHGETDAFRKAGRQSSYRDKILVTTLSPCWYCSGLVRQFHIGTVVVGESENFAGHLDWLREAGVRVVELDDPECAELMRRFIQQSPGLWNEDIGENEAR